MVNSNYTAVSTSVQKVNVGFSGGCRCEKFTSYMLCSAYANVSPICFYIEGRLT